MNVGGKPAVMVDADVEIIVGVIGVSEVADAPVANKSLPARGSRADCEERLSTEPQLIGRVQSSSPKPLSASDCPVVVLVLVAGEEEAVVELDEEVVVVIVPLGNGVARPLAASLSGCG